VWFLPENRKIPMTFKTVSLLQEDAIQKIQTESLRLLQDVGIQVGDPGCLELLVRAGAKVVGDSNVVRLPTPMVLEYVHQVCGEFDLVDLWGKRLKLPCQKAVAGSRLKMPKYLDYETTTSRQVCRQDMINMARLSSALPMMGWSLVIDCPASDGQPEVDYPDAMGLAYAITGHTVMTAPTTVEGMQMSIEMALAASGADSLDDFTNLMVCVNTTSPLQMASEECKVLRCAVENGVPIDVEPMTVAGASTPFTLAGTLMVENAEVLYMLCLANVIRPGAKVMASTVGSILNMKTPNLSLAAPESMLMASAEAVMTRLHGIPVMRMGGYCDSYYLDVQAGIEKAVFTLIVALSGADLVLMGGPLNNAAHQSCESVVIDSDVWELVERLTREIQVNDETLAYETTTQVGIGGSHLETAHTFKWLRSGEHYYGGSYNRSGRAGTEYTMLARAHDRVEGILGKPFAYAAPEKAVERIRQYVCDLARDRNVAPPEWPCS
jgi:trimethylamine--corrinoid protein Co-methyltransferase